MADFYPRLTKDGIYPNNQWYYGNNPFYLAGYGMPNCTCYAYGRSGEIANQFLDLPTGDAGDWYIRASNFSRGSTPALGAIGVWRSSSGRYSGHVAIVEQILSVTSVIFSCSGWVSRPLPADYYNLSSFFWTEQCSSLNGYQMNYMSSRDYVFQGFIYNPYAGDITYILPDWVKGNFWLDNTQMENNAIIVWSYLYFRGWSREAVSALLGNMEVESTINPGIWQNLTPYGDSGFGLVQFTPYTDFTDWADANGYAWDDGNAQLLHIDTQTVPDGQWIITPGHYMPFDTFKESPESPEFLAEIFVYNYLRPADISATLEARKTNAKKWYDYLQDIDPLQPGNIGDKTRKGMPVWMMTKRHKLIRKGLI